MPAPALLLLVAALLPLLSFGALALAGRRLGNPGAGWFATSIVAGSFLCSMLAMLSWYRGGELPGGAMPIHWGWGQGPIDLPIRWAPVGIARRPVRASAGGAAQRAGAPSEGGASQDSAPAAPRSSERGHWRWLDVGVYVDSLTITMFAMVTLVATLVHVFSVGYMRRDPRFPRFFAYLALFCFSMLGLVIAGSLVQIFIFWELVGACSYLLIGYWRDNRSAGNAAIKAFVVNRVGDAGFLAAFGILFAHLGNVTLPHLWLALGSAGLGGPIVLPDGSSLSQGMLTLIGVGLFLGAVGKSAQFPLHVWLPDAMEGPTPASALIHAATMVAAGVYLMGRAFPILTPGAKLVIAIVGLITLTMGALIALAQSDIKRVLACSTISQLGYMMLALGVGSWVGALFHLVTHAFFKSLLFLAAGSVIAAAGHEQEMPRFGGLARKLPMTAATFAAGVLAIAGAPLFSGYYSKEMILRHAGAFAALGSAGPSGRAGYWLFFIIPAAVTYLTAFYMTRCWTLTFWGEPRDRRLHRRARELPLLWGPLVALAFLSLIAGNWLSIPELLQGSIRETQAVCQRLREEAPARWRIGMFRGFETAWPGPRPGRGDRTVEEGGEGESPVTSPTPAAPEWTESQKAHVYGDELTSRRVSLAFAVGIVLAFLMYRRGYGVADRLMRLAPARWIHEWLYRRMYFDELYFTLLVAPVLGSARLAAWIDRRLVDGAVNALAAVARRAGAAAGLADLRVIDQAPAGAAAATRRISAAVRASQTGRVRFYVTVVAAAAALAMAGLVVAVAIARR